MPEPLLIRCPSCNHALSLPNEFLGQVVSCLECRTPFVAPTRDGDQLLPPKLLPKPVRLPAKVFLATYGLLLFGFAGLFLNGYLWFWFDSDPAAAARFAEANLQFMIANAPPDKEDKRPSTEEEKKAAAEKLDAFGKKQQDDAKQLAGQVNVVAMKRLRLVFAVVSLAVLIGGFCFALRRAYWYCFVACALVSVNSPDLGCCFFGVIIGMAGLLALVSDEGRTHFKRPT